MAIRVIMSFQETPKFTEFVFNNLNNSIHKIASHVYITSVFIELLQKTELMFHISLHLPDWFVIQTTVLQARRVSAIKLSIKSLWSQDSSVHYCLMLLFNVRL